MRFVRNLSFGIGLALLAFALAFAIITYGPRHYTVSHSHFAEGGGLERQKLIPDGPLRGHCSL